MHPLRLFIYLSVLALTFLTGFCQGFNRGYAVALQYDPACQVRANECILDNKEK